MLENEQDRRRAVLFSREKGQRTECYFKYEFVEW